MHGGAAALYLDNYTSAAFTALPNFEGSSSQESLEAIDGQPRTQYVPPGGISRGLNITYLRPVRLPATVRIEVSIVQHGRSASLVRGSIASLDGKSTYFTCEHHKINPLGMAPSSVAKKSSL
ncbi:MAG: hypothetical protein MMC23_008658 [Stictis urceolatum]|nr:hypothetical protein [Stictis urceolata]